LSAFWRNSSPRHNGGAVNKDLSPGAGDRSFITDKSEPEDVDIFLLMEDSFDVRSVSNETRLVFDHGAAQNSLGASVFWIRRAAALGGEEATISYWQIKRDRTTRGIVEVISRD
jgi:hypothetical protein